jgi:putative glutamine amidotransferase
MSSVNDRPLVGISAIPRTVPTGYGPDQADTVAQSVSAAIVAAGGTPIVLPVVPAAVAAEQVRALDALVLSGGQDLSGARLHGELPATAPWADGDRDAHEFAVWATASEQGLPILGLCRGLQLANVALDGTLFAHLDGHDAGPEEIGMHSITVCEGTILAAATAHARLQVNTIHHQAIADLAEGLEVSARAPDGTIEAAERRKPWFVGVQWHPELMLGRPGGQDLFEALVAVARAAR